MTGTKSQGERTTVPNIAGEPTRGENLDVCEIEGSVDKIVLTTQEIG